MRGWFAALAITGYLIGRYTYLQVESHELAHIRSATERGISAERTSFTTVAVGEHTMDGLLAGYRAELATWVMLAYAAAFVPVLWPAAGLGIGGGLGVAVRALHSYDFLEVAPAWTADLVSGWYLLCAWWLVPPLLLVGVWRLLPWEAKT